jgi:thioredoxin-like negative regulator of GroEL
MTSSIKQISTEEAYKRHVSNKKTKSSVILFLPDSLLAKDHAPYVHILETLSGVYKGQYNFYVLDLEEIPSLQPKYGVNNLPTLYIFNNENTIMASLSSNKPDLANYINLLKGLN